jgi:formate dehydrogenase
LCGSGGVEVSATLKGRQADDDSLQEVRDLVGADALRRDLLIEYLHRLNDAYGGLHTRHLVALAKLMNIPMAEVYEVATFYHHFEVIREGKAAADLTIRVCDGLSCELAGAKQLIEKLPQLLGNKAIKVVAAPCVGRCEQAPVAVVHQNAVPHATAESVASAVAHNQKWQALADYEELDAYVANGGYQLLKQIHNQSVEPEHIIQIMESSGLRGLGGAGFPAGRKWRIVREQAAHG